MNLRKDHYRKRLAPVNNCPISDPRIRRTPRKKCIHYATLGERRLAGSLLPRGSGSESKRTPHFQPHQTLNLNSKGRLAYTAGRPQPYNVVKLSATDVLAPTTMKNAAKCDTSCDLQNPVNHQNFERILRFRDTPGSMLVGVSVDTTRPSLFLGRASGGL